LLIYRSTYEYIQRQHSEVITRQRVWWESNTQQNSVSSMLQQVHHVLTLKCTVGSFYCKQSTTSIMTYGEVCTPRREELKIFR